MEETTAEFLVTDIAPRPPLTARVRVSVGAKTDLGRVRENNEDKFEFFVPSADEDLAWRGMAFVVCDGMGGHEAGQIASELACKTFLDVYRNHPAEDQVEAARAAVLAANRFVLDIARAVPGRKGMGTTLSALIIVDDRTVIAQVGDSRVYRLRDAELKQLTSDHTWVEETVTQGMMSREEAESHPYKHVLTRAIGTEPDVRPDVFDDRVQEGDCFLVCSDGLTNHVPDDDIQHVLVSNGPSEAAWELVGRALVGGGSDNATAIVVRIESVEAIG